MASCEQKTSPAAGHGSVGK